MRTFQSNIVSRLSSAIVAVMLLALLTATWPAAVAAPVTSKQAAAAVTGWLSLDRTPLGETLGASILRVETFSDKAGNPLYYIVYLDPSGFVVVAGDDLVEPIIGFARAGQYDPGTNNPLGALVGNDVPARVSFARQAGATLTSAAAAAQGKWQRLAAAAQNGPVGANELPLVTEDVRVAPLTQTTWDQQTADGAHTTACYNYYTPPGPDGNTANYPAGCVATAMAQLIRYWQFPNTGIGRAPFPITSSGSPLTYYTKGGDGSGGAYVWSNMPLAPPAAPTATQCQAIGALVADAGATVAMSYAASGSSASVLAAKNALVSTFHYANAVFGANGNANIGAGLVAMINPNLDAQCPVLLSIRGTPGGHAVLADGYGYSVSALYHHLNLGWSGVDSAWYTLPTIDTSNGGTYGVVDGCVYNLFTNGVGEIISGRVLDQIGRPIANAIVTATRTNSGTGTYTTNTTSTDGRGIYALAGLPSATSYSITITKTNYASVSTNLSTGTSSDWGATSGNQWVADLTNKMVTTVVDHFLWGAVASTQSLNQPFGVTIAAQNVTNGPVTSFTGSVPLNCFMTGLGSSGTLIGSLGWTSGRGSSAGLTYGYAFTPNTNLLVTAVRYFTGDKVSIWTDSGSNLLSQAVSGNTIWAEAPLATPIILTSGTTYRVSGHFPPSVYGYSTTAWPPTFVNGTVGQTFYKANGDNFPAEVFATGQGPLVDLRYQVQYSNSIPVSPTSAGPFANGVWSGNLTVSQVNTNVMLRVDDGAGHVALSSPFSVIDPNAVPPIITTQPQSRTNNTGDNATFSLSATSGQTPTYIWRRNSSPIGGATASSYTLNNVQLPDSGSLFSCIVSNNYGSRTSLTATLTVVCTNVVVAAQPYLTLNPGGAVNAVAPLSDGAAIFGGHFTNVNGLVRSNIARLLPNGALDATWNPGANDDILALAASGTNLYVGGYFTNIGSYARNYIAKLSATGTGAVDANWNPGAATQYPGADWAVSALAVNGTDLYAGGGFWWMGNLPRNCVAKVSAIGTGDVDGTWNPNATYYGQVDAIAVSGTNVYISGAFTNVSGLARTNLAKMSTTGNGAADGTWKPNAYGRVYALATSGTDVYVAGGFISVGGQSRSGVAKLSSTGTGAADATWNPNADNGVWAIAVRGQCVYAGGSFTNIGGLHRVGLAKLSMSGTGAADAAWEADCDGEVDAVATSYSALFVGGSFAQVAGLSRPGIAALTFASPRLSSPLRPGAGQFQCTLTGERGHNYDVLVSTNLANWDLFTNMVSSTGTTNFTDTTTSRKARFYRARSMP